MNRDEALVALSSAAPAERLAGARYLQFWAIPADIPSLREAINKETVGWVSRSLESALLRLGDKRTLTVDLDELSKDEGEATEDAAALARARIARTVVHELDPIAGAIAYYAELEIESYEASNTRKQVDRLAAILRAIETLGTISMRPKLERVNMRRLLEEIVESERTEDGGEIYLEGPASAPIDTDPGLVRLIVGNAVKNSCESTQQVGDRPTRITVLYGLTDRDGWVTVIDNGIGLPTGSSTSLFEMGTSTKEDHLGMGLALSKEATRALNGRLRLMTDPMGTRFEFTFPAGDMKP